MICIIDYGAGNLRSVQKAVEFIGGEAVVTADVAAIENADRVIFPGVGAFGKAMAAIDQLALRSSITDFIAAGKPFLGICLGLQLLFEESEEDPGVRGLSVLRGTVKRFSPQLKVPHLGWNVLIQVVACPLWKNIPDSSYFYFAHSYYISPDEDSVVVGVSDYGLAVPVAIRKNNLYGLQFHPEKSQKVGLEILKNFVSI
jgi:glutamine amidotransferase